MSEQYPPVRDCAACGLPFRSPMIQTGMGRARQSNCQGCINFVRTRLLGLSPLVGPPIELSLTPPRREEDDDE